LEKRALYYDGGIEEDSVSQALPSLADGWKTLSIGGVIHPHLDPIFAWRRILRDHDLVLVDDCFALNPTGGRPCPTLGQSIPLSPDLVSAVYEMDKYRVGTLRQFGSLPIESEFQPFSGDQGERLVRAGEPFQVVS
jgi:hypothetical protein